MKSRSFVAFTAVAALAATSCGGGSGTLSAEDFADVMSDICADAERGLVDLQAPDDVAGLESFARDASEVLTATRDRLADVKAPDGVDADFTNFVANIDDQIDALDDLEAAGKNDDEAAAEEVFTTMGDLNDERDQLAQELGVDGCTNDDETATSDPPATEAATTDPVATVATVALTLPPTVPPATASPDTTPVDTVPSETAPSSGQSFAVVDLTTSFVAPPNFTLVNSDPAAAQAFIDIVAAVPQLNKGVLEMGVGVLLDDTGTAIATIVVGIAIGDNMPGEWKDILCGTDGTLRTSADGYTGITCPGAAGSGVTDIFTLTEADLGLSIASLVDGLPADLVADAFFEANLT